MLSIELSETTGTGSCALCQQSTKKGQEMIKVYVLNIMHMGTDESDRKLKEKEVELIRFLGDGEHLRGEVRELFK